MIKKFLYFFTVNIVVKFLSFGTLLAVATIITPQELGNLKTIQSISEVIITISILGLNTAFLRFYPISTKEKKYKIETTYFFTILASSLAITLIALLLIENNKLYLLVVPASALTSIYLYIYQLQDKYKELAFNQTVIKIFSFLSIVFTTKLYGLNGFILSSVVVTYAGLIFLYLRNKIKIKKENMDIKLIQSSYDISKFALLSTVISVITVNIGIYILNATGSDEKLLGVFSFSLILLMVFNILRNVVQQFISPILTKASEDRSNFIGKFKYIQKIVYFGFLIISILAIIFFYIIYTHTPKILHEYSESFKYVMLMIVPWLISSFYIVKIVALNSLGLTRDILKKDIIIFPITIIVSYILTEYYSILGLIISQYILSVLTCLVVQAIFTKRINSYSFGKK